MNKHSWLPRYLPVTLGITIQDNVVIVVVLFFIQDWASAIKPL